MPPEHVAELEALDPWWRPPWTVMWQRFYYQARDHTRAHGALRPEHGFPTTRFGLGEWLYNQCAGYDTLHPGQQRLLASIGLTPEAVRAARPRRKHMATHFQSVLACARAFADAHGTLVTATTDTVQDGLKLGQWLSNQRSKDRARQLRHGSPSPRALALSAIDPWWNPPWDLAWQRACTRARTTQTRPHGVPADVRTWIRAQHAAWPHLRPQQQQLLTDLDITPEAAARRRTSRVYPVSPGLAHARAYAALHGHLSCSKDTRHDGFALGDWLVQTRRKARQGRLAPTTSQALDTIAPWWNPPWPSIWQRIYEQAKLNHHTGQAHSPALQRWTEQQRTRWNTLHHTQRELLSGIGIHPV
ncbi:helicase associated domain-containing protein [Streptomyces sichuanensis]|uniref:helicase associated domain-containing protein n=1 Tax=Streptomyces sichuanensis TaxID=2871810 RepID=UPI0021F09D7D|nr:helicase associated domain-containing protein [Streptomyces sichuanensis]